MKKRKSILPVIICLGMILSACGGEKETDTSSLFESMETESAVAEDQAASAPVEYETADGYMGSFLLASDRDKIDTTNEYGVFYKVVYSASFLNFWFQKIPCAVLHIVR